MKKHFILLISVIFVFVTFFNCQDENNSFKSAEGYIVGSFRCNESDGENGVFTGNSTPQGFVIVFENENDSVYTFSLSEYIFEFPAEILEQGANVYNCGPIYFSDKREYKIKFNYKKSKDSEIIYFACFCYDHLIPYDWSSIDQVIIEDVEYIK